MARSRYWKITAEEMGSFAYEHDKLANWEIKCPKEGDQSSFVGVFLYRRGTPYDYESINGVCLYHNNLDKPEVEGVAGMLEKEFGGKRMEKGERMFLKGSKETYSPAEIGALASRVGGMLGGEPVISLEFEDLTAEQLGEAGLPEAKLLPIPGG